MTAAQDSSAKWRFPGLDKGGADLIADGRLFGAPVEGPAKFDPEIDRVMLCGSTAMIKETAGLLEAAGLEEGSNAKPGQFVIERAFVD